MAQGKMLRQMAWLCCLVVVAYAVRINNEHKRSTKLFQ